MTKKSTAPAAAAAAPEPEETQSFAELWDSFEPGARVSKGSYSIYKTGDGGMHIAYRAEGAGEDGHMPIPAMMLQMMIAATEGKGPLGRLKAVAMARLGGQ
jgi:hypothetical protein